MKDIQLLYYFVNVNTIYTSSAGWIKKLNGTQSAHTNQSNETQLFLVLTHFD